MITVFGSIGMDMLFALPHLPALGETVLAPSTPGRSPAIVSDVFDTILSYE
jgi:hypothetical protein